MRWVLVWEEYVYDYDVMVSERSECEYEMNILVRYEYVCKYEIILSERVWVWVLNEYSQLLLIMKLFWVLSTIILHNNVHAAEWNVSDVVVILLKEIQCVTLFVAIMGNAGLDWVEPRLPPPPRPAPVAATPCVPSSFHDLAS